MDLRMACRLRDTVNQNTLHVMLFKWSSISDGFILFARAFEPCAASWDCCSLLQFHSRSAGDSRANRNTAFP